MQRHFKICKLPGFYLDMKTSQATCWCIKAHKVSPRVQISNPILEKDPICTWTHVLWSITVLVFKIIGMIYVNIWRGKYNNNIFRININTSTWNMKPSEQTTDRLRYNIQRLILTCKWVNNSYRTRMYESYLQ